MDCSRCGSKVGGVNLVVGIVKVTTCHCKDCGKVWRIKTLLVAFSVSVFVGELERLHAKYPDHRPVVIKSVMTYLQGKVDAHMATQLDEEAAKRKRRNDMWERQFLKDALGEDYR